jgi:hypothetical protein
MSSFSPCPSQSGPEKAVQKRLVSAVRNPYLTGNMSRVNVPKHLYWSCRESATVDAENPSERGWLLERTLRNGTMADIRKLDMDEIEEALPSLRLPRHVQALWRDFFGRKHSVPISPKDP